MIQVKIYNDGKEKPQSYEAIIDDGFYLEGYGKDRNEAIENLRKRVNSAVIELLSIDYDTFTWITHKYDQF